jgi:hypothetical protein
MKTTVRSLILGLTLAAASTSVLAGAYDDLITAVNRDDNATVVDLIYRGMDVNTVDSAGNTLLHLATRNGNDSLITALLKLKANPNARNRVGDTPLMLAAHNGKLSSANALLAGGAEANTEGWAPLHYAVFAEQPEIVSLLIAKGAKVDARAPNQQTPLMLAARTGNLQIGKLLLNAKADPVLKDQHDETAATLAQKNNNSDFARLLEQPIMPVKAEPTVAPKPVAKAVPSTPVKPEGDMRGEYVSPPFQTEKAAPVAPPTPAPAAAKPAPKPVSTVQKTKPQDDMNGEYVPPPFQSDAK